ncbi:MAG: C1 family peptidase [Planctomycetota bacterium]
MTTSGGLAGGRGGPVPRALPATIQISGGLRQSINVAPRTRWSVRDQGQRGTCVAFAMSAVRECRAPALTRLSEQFAYWSAKTSALDQAPQQDGTLLECVVDGLGSHGVCEASRWRYSPNVIAGDVTHGTPSRAAIRDALGRQCAPWLLVHRQAQSGWATKLLSQLVKTQRPVAITLPVFEDPTTGNNNWNTAVGWSEGKVFNPLPGTSVQHGGHAVCVTGFEPDPNEPVGGYFIVRNSWGAAWGRSTAVNAHGFSTPSGYGYVGASYVDLYAWELAQ